ncbi:MAG: DUF4263 domain-containing protein, partial [Verrucomicrobia bacterium]|nr:DUF4263 domain-containing protein [Leptolyngbya sp. ES-bin-22]
FTGACIEDWGINITTRLDDIDCDYVYLKYDRIEGYLKREPSNRKFLLGEFTQLFQADRSYSKLAVLGQLINRFEKLLNEFPEGHESLFHDFLKENPILIDVYVGQNNIVSKPRFHYPPGESPLGKVYVEPDFVIKYAGNKYKLVELEKPGKHIATKQGQPTSGVNQAAFQIAEWDDYIRNHIDRIKDEFPGIANNRSYLIVLGRSDEKSIGAGRDPGRYMRLIASQYSCEVCSYDDLLDKAKQAHSALIALSA